MKNSSLIAYNALKLVASGALGQMVALLLLMIVGRQYNEEMMGVLGSFLSWGGILSIATTGRYEQAIVIAPSEQEAYDLYICGIRLSTLLSAVLFLGSLLIYLLIPEQTLGVYILLLPLFVLFTSLYAHISSMALRNKSFNRLSLAQSINGVGNNLLKVVWGSFHPSVIGLISSSITAIFLAFFSYIPFIKKVFRRPVSPLSASLAIARKYRNFPRYSLPQALIDTLLGSLLILLLPLRFGMAEVGFLTMSIMLARRPLNIIGENLGKVYFQRLSETVHNAQSIAPTVRRLLLITFILGIPLALALAWGMEYLVLFFVGNKWLVSAYIIRWMLPMLIPNFAAAILNVIPDILGFQRSNMWSQIIMLALYTTAILLGFYCFSFERFIPFFYTCMAFVQIGYLLYLLRLVAIYERTIQKNN